MPSIHAHQEDSISYDERPTKMHGIEYATDYELSLEQLAEIKPEHMYKWMAVKTYGAVNQTQAKTTIQQMVLLDQPQWNSS